MFAVSGLLCDYGKHFISYDLLFIIIFVGIEIYEMKFTSHFFIIKIPRNVLNKLHAF